MTLFLFAIVGRGQEKEVEIGRKRTNWKKERRGSKKCQICCTQAAGYCHASCILITGATLIKKGGTLLAAQNSGHIRLSTHLYTKSRTCVYRQSCVDV